MLRFRVGLGLGLGGRKSSIADCQLGIPGYRLPVAGMQYRS